MNLKAVPADFPAERVTGLVDKASDAGEGFAGWLEEPIVNLCEHVADSFMKANADFRYKAGMSPRIRRDSGARCCDWCADLDGVYDYKDAPKEVYARHEFCRCVVTFENGRERQNVWTKERWMADRDELDRRREYGLTDERERENMRMYRRTANTGVFSGLKETMTLKHVRQVVKEMGLDPADVTYRINRDIDMLNRPIAGQTSDNGKYIILYPNAFIDREQLVKTIGHENTHLIQVRNYGRVETLEESIKRESEAITSENVWWEDYVKKTGYRP